MYIYFRAILLSLLLAQNSQDVVELLRQLDSPLSSDRDKSQKAILEMGPEVFSKLESVRGKLGVEGEARLAQILAEFRSRELNTVFRPSKPTTLMFKIETGLAGSALDLLQSQFGVTIGTTDFTLRRTQLSLVPAVRSFWQAFDATTEGAGLAPAFLARSTDLHEACGIRLEKDCSQAQYSRSYTQGDLRITAV